MDTTLLAVQNAGYVHEGDLSAGTVAFDGADSEIAAGDVQGAIVYGDGVAQGAGGRVAAFKPGGDPVNIRVAVGIDTVVVAFGEVARIR